MNLRGETKSVLCHIPDRVILSQEHIPENEEFEVLQRAQTQHTHRSTSVIKWQLHHIGLGLDSEPVASDQEGDRLIEPQVAWNHPQAQDTCILLALQDPQDNYFSYSCENVR